MSDSNSREAAAYLLGVISGLTVDRTYEFYVRHKDSWLNMTRVGATARQVLLFAGNGATRPHRRGVSRDCLAFSSPERKSA